MPRLGPFFFIRSRLIFDARPLEAARRQADKLDNPFSHEKLYDEHFSSGDYIDFPQGRLIWGLTHGRAIVYIDPCIKRPDVLAQIAAAFELGDYVVAQDEHYRCRRCAGELF